MRRACYSAFKDVTLKGSHAIAGGKQAEGLRRPRNSMSKDFDPEGGAYSTLRCAPFRVGFFFCIKPGAALTLAPGYYMYPLRG